MESSNNSEFPNYSSVFRSSVNLYDHTDTYPTATNTNSNLLNGGNNQQIGVAKTYKVMPGDKVKIEAWGKYSNPTQTASNVPAFATALLSAFGATAPVTGEVGTASSALNNYGGVVAAGNGPTSTGPKAFVNILVFDKNHNLLDVAYEAMDPGALETGSSVPFDYMMREYTVKEAGYVYMYVSNENATRVDVYFDDIVMTYTPGNVIQYNEYYPFGMRTAASWDRMEDKPMPSLQQNLVARILFDGNGQDGSGNANHATLSNGAATTKTQGRPEGLFLDGTDDYGQINDNATVDFGANDFSIAIWVKKLAATSSNDNREVIHKWDSSQPVTNNEWNLMTSSNGTDSKPYFLISTSAGYTTLTSPDEITIGTWNHLAVTRTGSTIKLFVNGILKASANIGTSPVLNVGRNVTIGRMVGGTALYTNAVYDDLYIYGRALTEEELRYLYLDKPELMVNSYLYNGASEYSQTDNWYETFFRGYDQALGRFLQVDPMADKYAGLSPYNYAFNSPIVRNDPNGDDPDEDMAPMGYNRAIATRLSQLIDMGYGVFFTQGSSDSWGVYQAGRAYSAAGGAWAGHDAYFDKQNLAMEVDKALQWAHERLRNGTGNIFGGWTPEGGAFITTYTWLEGPANVDPSQLSACKDCPPQMGGGCPPGMICTNDSEGNITGMTRVDEDPSIEGGKIIIRGLGEAVVTALLAEVGGPLAGRALGWAFGRLFATTATKGIQILLRNGYYEADGLKIAENYYNKLWATGRGAPFLVAREVLEGSARGSAHATEAGFYWYSFGGWEMIFNPTTKVIMHLQPI